MLARSLKRITATDIAMFVIGGAIGLMVIVGSILEIFVRHTYTGQQWFDLFVSGIAMGSVYSLFALGYTMVYGILRLINFAHSEVFMSGPFTAYFLAIYLAESGFLNANPVLSLVAIFALAMAVSTLVAVIVERVAYRPLRNAPRLVPLITAIGASFFLQYYFRGLFGVDIKVYPTVTALTPYLDFGGYRIQYVQLLIIVAAALMMVSLNLFVQRSQIGKAMRAVSEDKETAALMGIDVDRIITITFAIGGALAGAAGVLYVLMFPEVYYLMGFIPGIKAFTAAVLGGIGNIPGAMLGGLFLGIIEAVGPSLFLDGLGIPAPYQLKDAIAFTLLVFVLIFRPSGILGEHVGEKKA
ncbi:MAG: branched-chain amino acid ABC transporter permease [Chloroflexi bacterium]|nr:branched-chain amino acid ABC transporter permease [Chloroflexota bacterium]